MKQLGEDRESDCATALAGSTTDQRAKYHGERDLPVCKQMLQSEAASESQPGYPGKKRDQEIEAKRTSPAWHGT
jgi:hypothetical protein